MRDRTDTELSMAHAHAAEIRDQSAAIARLEAQAVKAESAQLQLIDERDAAEQSLSQVYYLVIGNSPEWSNNFGHEQALDEIGEASNGMRLMIKRLEAENARLRCGTPGCHRLDTPAQVLFYENDFYPLSNFSAFALSWKGFEFPTSEHAYHWEKFPDYAEMRDSIRFASSAHEAFKCAEKYRTLRRADWDAVKVDIMKGILIEKMMQHEYVRLKLLATGDRELIEDSWRDDFWGWGQNHDGKNMLGRLWMEIRAALASAQPASR